MRRRTKNKIILSEEKKLLEQRIKNQRNTPFSADGPYRDFTKSRSILYYLKPVTPRDDEKSGEKEGEQLKKEQSILNSFKPKDKNRGSLRNFPDLKKTGQSSAKTLTFNLKYNEPAGKNYTDRKMQSHEMYIPAILSDGASLNAYLGIYHEN